MKPLLYVVCVMTLAGCASTRIYQQDAIAEQGGVWLDKAALAQGRVEPIDGTVVSQSPKWLEELDYQGGRVTAERLMLSQDKTLVRAVSFDAMGRYHGDFFSPDDTSAKPGSEGNVGQMFHGVRIGNWHIWDNNIRPQRDLQADFQFGVNANGKMQQVLQTRFNQPLPWQYAPDVDTRVIWENQHNVDTDRHPQRLTGWVGYIADNKSQQLSYFEQGVRVASWRFSASGMATAYQEWQGDVSLRCGFSQGQLYECRQQNSQGELQGMHLSRWGNKYRLVTMDNRLVSGALAEWDDKAQILSNRRFLAGADHDALMGLNQAFGVPVDWLTPDMSHARVQTFTALSKVPKHYDGWALVYDSRGLKDRVLFQKGRVMQKWWYSQGMIRTFEGFDAQGRKIQFSFNKGLLAFFTQYRDQGKTKLYRLAHASGERKGYYKVEYQHGIRQPGSAYYQWHEGLQSYQLVKSS